MKRNLNQLSSRHHDLLIIGGGIYGATAAWEAASRNLSVALIDKGDFACATSSNSHKIIHGGLRYLQQADIVRIRESIKEYRILMKIAPHLVSPMPFLMPSYGHGIRGPEVFNVASKLYRIIGYDINHSEKGQINIPTGKVISKEECIKLFPGAKKDKLTGAGLWFDGQVYNTERLLMSFLETAYLKGACLANYIEMIKFIEADNSVSGVIATDKVSGKEIEIKAKVVVNTSGPWVDAVLDKFVAKPIHLRRKFALALNIVTKPIVQDYAVAVKSQHEDDATIIDKGGRMYVITPWHKCSLIGTSQKFFEGEPDGFKVTEGEISSFINEINLACPSFKLRRADVLSYHAGLLPQAEKQNESSDVKIEKRYEIVDHQERDNVKGLISVVGVKYTTARDVTKKVIDLACKKLGLNGNVSITHCTQISGGNINNLKVELSTFLQKRPFGLENDIYRHLFFTFGSKINLIMAIIKERRELGNRVTKNLPIIGAEIVYGLKYGMAMRLEDIIFRRTELATLGNPGDDVLLHVSKMASTYHKWSTSQIYKEIDEVKRLF